MKTYSELILLPTFEERFEYLKLTSAVGATTFGGERWMNQTIYASSDWRRVRDKVIIRDNGCDLGIEDRIIRTKIYIHHIEPITIHDVMNRTEKIFDPDNLICVSFNTHQAIHYSDANLLIPSVPIARTPNDQAPWKK